MARLPVIELPAADAAESPPTVAPVPGVITDLHVLLIDDTEDVREVLTLQLERFFKVDEAATVEQALAMVAGPNSYDVVICDLMMPSGGAEIWLSRCRSIAPRLEERTILLTGGPTTEAARALVEARREKVVFKPVDIAELRPMIERIASE